MSTVDAVKFEQISVSLANTFGIFEGGKTSIGEGQLVSSGMTQLNNLDEFFSNMGEKSEQSDIETNNENDESSKDSTQDLKEIVEVNQATEVLLEEMEKVSTSMHDEISDLTEQYSLSDYVELSIDPEYQYVQLTLKGSILFDSGEAEIKEGALPILSKIGDLLKKFDQYSIEIEGHTDNIPMTSETFKDNKWLSSARALNTADYLIQNKKLDPVKVKYSGRGEYEPIASNSTRDGRAKNRRIEIKIFNQYSSD